jgi:hypothetical protein
VCAVQKIDFLVHSMAAAARGLPTLHTFSENKATLVTTLDDLAKANSAATSGTLGAAGPSIPAAVSTPLPPCPPTTRSTQVLSVLSERGVTVQFVGWV